MRADTSLHGFLPVIAVAAVVRWRHATRLTVSEQQPESPQGHRTWRAFPISQQSDLPPEHQDILARPIALNRAMANSPNAAQAR